MRMDDAVTAVGMILGGVITLVVLEELYRGAANEWPAVAIMGIGALLLVGSQYQSIKISKEGIEAVRRDIKDTAEATEEVTKTTRELAKALADAHTQIAGLVRHLERDDNVPKELSDLIQSHLDLAPKVDLTRLGSAEAKLTRVRAG